MEKVSEIRGIIQDRPSIHTVRFERCGDKVEISLPGVKPVLVELEDIKTMLRILEVVT